MLLRNKSFVPIRVIRGNPERRRRASVYIRVHLWPNPERRRRAFVSIRAIRGNPELRRRAVCVHLRFQNENS